MHAKIYSIRTLVGTIVRFKALVNIKEPMQRHILTLFKKQNIYQTNNAHYNVKISLIMIFILNESVLDISTKLLLSWVKVFRITPDFRILRLTFYGKSALKILNREDNNSFSDVSSIY